MRKVVICALDINVLSFYFYEQGWETLLGTLKVSGLYHKKVKFPLKISDRVWWLEVQVLKSHGNKSRRKNDKGPQDMEIDCIKNVTTDLSAKACQTKDVLTEVDHPPEQTIWPRQNCNPYCRPNSHGRGYNSSNPTGCKFTYV